MGMLKAKFQPAWRVRSDDIDGLLARRTPRQNGDRLVALTPLLISE